MEMLACALSRTHGRASRPQTVPLICPHAFSHAHMHAGDDDAAQSALAASLIDDAPRGVPRARGGAARGAAS